MVQSLLRLHWIDQPQTDALHCYDKQQHPFKESKLWMTYYWLLLPRKFWIVDKYEEFAFLPHNTFCLYHPNFCCIMTVVCHFLMSTIGSHGYMGKKWPYQVSTMKGPTVVSKFNEIAEKASAKLLPFICPKKSNKAVVCGEECCVTTQKTAVEQTSGEDVLILHGVPIASLAIWLVSG